MSGRPQPSGLGALLHTEYEHVDLGTHHERVLRARVRRRSLRFALGRGRRFSVALGQARPVAIEVTEAGERYDVLVPVRSDPWVRLGWRLALLWIASLILVRVVRGGRRGDSRSR